MPTPDGSHPRFSDKSDAWIFGYFRAFDTMPDTMNADEPKGA
ncbi:MAG: hypothetical protein AAF668_09530 [Pseudomonadota bacterium]